MRQRTKLAVIATHPIQYQAPLWRLIASDQELDVLVFYGSDFSTRGYKDKNFGTAFSWDVPLLAGYKHVVLSGGEQVSDADRFIGIPARDLASQLRSYKPDVALLNAYTPFYYLRAFWLLRRQRVPIILRIEATDVASHRGRIMAGLRSALLKRFYARCTYFLAIGRNAGDHFLRHGAPEQRIGASPYCVDDQLFEKQFNEFAPQRKRLRAELGYSDEDIVLVFSGKLIPKKDSLIIAEALKRLDPRTRLKYGLLVLGNGTLKATLQRSLDGLLTNKVHFAGFVNQSQLGRVYSTGDAIVLPSVWGETWGLVINEAMQFELPAIVSEKVGCGPDLVIPGSTGYHFAAGNADMLAARLQTLAALSMSERALLREQSRAHVKSYSIEKTAAGIAAAAKRFGKCEAAGDDVRTPANVGGKS